MTQTSFLLGQDRRTDGFGNPPHDTGPYTSLEWRERQRILHAGDRYNGSGTPVDAVGIMASYLNRLAVTVTPGSPDVVNVNTGACFVDGNMMRNSASVQITPTAPGAPATYTVVVVLNDADTAYTTSISAPGGTDYDDAVNSIPSRSCRLAIMNAAPASLVQTSAVFMIALYTFSIDVAGNITNLTDVRSYLDTETFTSFYSSIVAKNITDGTDLFGTTDARGVPLPTGKLSATKFAFVVPWNFLGDMQVRPVVIPLLNGNMYALYNSYNATCGEDYNTDTDTTGWAAIALTNSDKGYNCLDWLSIANANVGDYVVVNFSRDGTDILDTITDVVYIRGLEISYLGFRR